MPTTNSPLAKLIFNKVDNGILKHEFDDNQKVEPVHYLPVIPMVLVNGAKGLGTGWSTDIPNHNPQEIIQNLLNMLDGKDPTPMVALICFHTYPCTKVFNFHDFAETILQRLCRLDRTMW